MKLINLLPPRPKRWAIIFVYQKRLRVITAVLLIGFIQLIVASVLFEKLALQSRQAASQEKRERLEKNLASYKDRQVLILTLNHKLSALKPLLSARFPYDAVYSDIDAVVPDDSRIVDLTITSTGNLNFSLQAPNAYNIDLLIKAILDHSFSQSFTYALKNAARNTNGTYLLSFIFAPKS